MLINKKTIAKLERLVPIYSPLIHIPLADLAWEGMFTGEHFRTCPPDGPEWAPVESGLIWGEAWQTLWLRSTFTLPGDYSGGKLYLQADTGAVETLLIVDGRYRGIFNIETEEGVRGHHHTRLVLMDPEPGSSHSLALECYAGHPCVGTQPFDPRGETSGRAETYRRTYRHGRLCTRNTICCDFVTELTLLLQIAACTGPDSFRGAGIYHGLREVFRLVPQQPSDFSRDELDLLLTEARQAMKPLLEMKNGGSAPSAGITGHSHMDTAWLWTVDETIRKCARTFSNSLSLMEEYDDYRFLTSAPCHLQMMKEEYPPLFDDIKKRVSQGRWELNGGSWVEPDCNIPSGESLTRHFLYGQKFLKEHFGKRADAFWQPDVFGYSASLPQILTQCGIVHFLTTKLGWNEDNRFPYDSFRWHGIDGSQVLTHFNTTHNWPGPESLIAQTNDIQHKDVQRARYCSFGYGDGGGGPLWEMLEIAPYMNDIDGVPKTRYQTVSDFMAQLGKEEDLPLWKGELYLELHRGTLTSLHNIKRLNRLCEQALRDGEILYALASAEGRADYEAPLWEGFWKILLMNQFHDILPGTSIPEVNQRALKELAGLYERVRRETEKLGDPGGAGKEITLWNTQAWERNTAQIPWPDRKHLPVDEGLSWQLVTDVAGETLLYLENLKLPPMGSVSLTLVEKAGDDVEGQGKGFLQEKGPGRWDTPLYALEFGPLGELVSLYDKGMRREILDAPAGLLLGEDYPAMWDNWDIDVDQPMKAELLAARGAWAPVQNGPLQARLANRFLTPAGSLVEQHIVLYRHKGEIEFDTRVEWKETHKLLKADFPLDLETDRARFEVQYGFLDRDTHDNLPQDRSRFEVSNHRWTHISEPGYGVTLMNDSSYGISIRGARAGLSLLKSGTHPDPFGDRGVHRLRYALLPGTEGFSVPSVVRPAGEFNAPPTILDGSRDAESFVRLGADNVILESLKGAEDGRGIILRLYEGEKKRCFCPLAFKKNPKRVTICNMLEEDDSELTPHGNGTIELAFRGLEIKNLRIEW